LKDIVDFMKSEGILHLEHEGSVITLSSAYLTPPEQDTWDTNSEESAELSPYEDPMLYPGGVDPVAESRAREREREQS